MARLFPLVKQLLRKAWKGKARRVSVECSLENGGATAHRGLRIGRTGKSVPPKWRGGKGEVPRGVELVQVQVQVQVQWCSSYGQARQKSGRTNQMPLAMDLCKLPGAVRLSLCPGAGCWCLVVVLLGLSTGVLYPGPGPGPGPGESPVRWAGLGWAGLAGGLLDPSPGRYWAKL
ncbi:hypothetical protein BDP81DRAFT_30237 [Colletotrichum phormii]|uniref:Uncharacterized protein n=1 Tax=Colletotrichum phormii TaxID=359342 RepID=A0AAI9ZRJ9_9PEZI|nr:uncharacterized protein BDP81DRAFT_30237 [Colletotrichum phormii]KAK1636886.1 hypothetical protein BDP81DRAFT_30237 [Colletotrichum phormii]